MRKLFACALICIFAAVFFSGPANAQNAVTGTWKTIADEGEDKGKANSYVDIYEKDGAYFGKVVKLLLKPQDTLCDKCTGDLKNKPVVGMLIINNMKKTGSSDEELGEEYAGGSVMDPDNGKTYKCKIWIKDDVLTLRGYVGFLYRTQQWYRVN